MEKKTYFVSGHSTIDIKDFIKLYIPLLDVALSEGAHFVIGDCDGVDAMAQSYLKQKIDESEHDRVKVFYTGSVPQNFLSTKFMAIGNFVSHTEAAVAMTLCSDEDIVCVDEDKRASLTASNVLRRFTPKFNFKRYADAKKRNTKFWDSIWYGKGEQEKAEV